jgi:hypothetical protein
MAEGVRVQRAKVPFITVGLVALAGLALGACSSKPQESAAAAPTTPSTIATNTTVDPVVSAWCGFKLGVDENTVVAALGQPTAKSTSNDVTGTAGTVDLMKWELGSHVFVVSFDNGKAFDYVAYAGPDGKSPANDLPCPGHRSN